MREFFKFLWDNFGLLFQFGRPAREILKELEDASKDKGV